MINTSPKLTTAARFLFAVVPLYTSIAPTSPRNNIAVPAITLSRFCSVGSDVISGKKTPESNANNANMEYEEKRPNESMIGLLTTCDAQQLAIPRSAIL